jgi:hypothetical protein
MKTYVDKNDPNIYQIGMPAPGMIPLPDQYDLSDLSFLTITPRVEQELDYTRQDPVLDENGDPVYQVDGNGDVVTDAEGNPVQETTETEVYKDVTYYDFTLDSSAKQAAATAKDKEKQIEAAYRQMNVDVYAEMAQVFGTTNPESATAYEATWKMMAETPAEYASLGLTSRFDVAGLAVGDALDTEQKVLDYANAKIADVQSYGKNRMQRIEQFRSERETILNS